MTQPDFTISNLSELHDILASNQHIRALVFDIDGTLSRGDIVTSLFSEALNYLSLPLFDIQSTLGRQNWLTTSWLAQNLSISDEQAQHLINRTRDRFLQLSSVDIQADLFDETIYVLTKLKEIGLLLGIFTMRHWQLALYQIMCSTVDRQLDKNATLIPNSSLRLTGSGLGVGTQKNGLEEKTGQLRLHLNGFADLQCNEIAVVGDALETDIAAAKIVGVNAILIKR